jgi:ligand-binding sensor domain-containing protein
LVSLGQGLSFCKNFGTGEFGHPQNWAITQDSNGSLYFGNTSGLIKFDGQKWNYIHIPGETVRSLLTSSEGTIYYGSNTGFGLIQSDSLNRMKYKSLVQEIDSTYRNSSTIWNIIEYHGEIYFQGLNGIHIWDGDTMRTVTSEYPTSQLQKANGKLLLRLKGKGLAYLENYSLKFINGSEDFANDSMYTILSYQGYFLIGSWEKGLTLFDGKIFKPFQTPANDYLVQHQIYRATYVDSERIAFATLTGGIVILNLDGTIDRIITQKDGLNTSAIYELFVDDEEILWAATNNGISKININNPLTKYSTIHGVDGTIDHLATINDYIYAGSTEGLFYLDRPENDNFISVPKIDRVYDLVEYRDYFVVATPQGLFRISTPSNPILIVQQEFQHFANNHFEENKILGSSGKAIFEIGLKDDPHQILQVDFQMKEILAEKNGIWVLSLKSGVYRYSYEGNLLKHYDLELTGRDDYQTIMKKKDHILVGTDKGLYRYDREQDIFVSDKNFNDPEIENNQVMFIEQCSENELWIRANRKMKRALYDEQRWDVKTSPYNLIDEGETVFDVECTESGIWFGGTSDIYHLSDPEWEYDYDFNTNVTGLLVHNDSLIYGGYGEPDQPIELPYEDNQLRFTYAAASYVAPELNMYKVRLRGYDNGWSDWTSETEKDYTFIPEGTYTFEVQGRNVYHKTGSIDSLTFTVLPPWYRTWWAYGLYLLMIGGVLYGAHQLRISRILREQRIRNRIASDLHDEVSATLSSITYFAQAIRQTQNGGKSERFVGLISESASDAKEKITDIIWSIDPDNDDWVNLLSKCRRFASDLFESKDMDYDLDIDTDINRPLDIELRQHLWLIFKEMVVNAARHSEARKVDISFGLKGNTLRLVVQDNGVGIGEELKRKSGHGIKNIKKRAGKIGAELKLETDSKIGTRWIMRLSMR